MPEKREIVEQTAQDFEKLPNDMKKQGGRAGGAARTIPYEGY